MKFRACLMFFKTLILPRSAKKSTARKSVLGAIICIAISIVPLIVVISVTDGMISGMIERIVALSSGHLQTFFYQSSTAKKSYEDLFEFSETARHSENVKSAFPELKIDALASFKQFRTGVVVRCVEVDSFVEDETFKKYMNFIAGDLNEFTENSKSALVGKRTAEILNLNVGDTIRIITTKKNVNNMIIPQNFSFKVSAIVSSGYQELDAMWVFIPIKTAYSLKLNENANASIVMQVDSPFSTDLYKTRQKISSIFKKNGITYTWTELNASQLENFSSTKIMLTFIMILIVLVASINISSALVMLVMERKNEIAILKSTGASSQGITLSFLMAGGFCGLVGMILALPVSFLIVLNLNNIIAFFEKVLNFFTKITFVLNGNDAADFVKTKLLDPEYYLEHLTPVISFKQIGIIFICVILLSLLVSFLPAVKAGREKPLDILRK